MRASPATASRASLPDVAARIVRPVGARTRAASRWKSASPSTTRIVWSPPPASSTSPSSPLSATRFYPTPARAASLGRVTERLSVGLPLVGTYGRAYGLSVSRRARGRSTCQHLHGSDGAAPVRVPARACGEHALYWKEFGS